MISGVHLKMVARIKTVAFQGIAVLVADVQLNIGRPIGFYSDAVTAAWQK